MLTYNSTNEKIFLDPSSPTNENILIQEILKLLYGVGKIEGVKFSLDGPTNRKIVIKTDISFNSNWARRNHKNLLFKTNVSFTKTGFLNVLRFRKAVEEILEATKGLREKKNQERIFNEYKEKVRQDIPLKRGESLWITGTLEKPLFQLSLIFNSEQSVKQSLFFLRQVMEVD